MKGKRFLSAILICCFILCGIPLTTLKANAATISIEPGKDEISSTAYLTIYNSAKKKTYNVVKIKGEYYAQFKYKGNTVNVKWPRRCYRQSKNDFSYTNNKIGKAISNRTNYDGREVFQTLESTPADYVSYDHWRMAYIQASGSYSSGKIALKTKKLSGLRISFASTYQFGNIWLKPKNCKTYKKCLHIRFEDSAISLTPKWDVKIVTPGKNKNVLSTYKIAGLGKAKQKNNIDTLFYAYYTTKNIITTTVPSLTASSLYNLYRQGASLKGSDSTGYNTGETYLLSKNKGDDEYYSCMRANFTAPLEIRKAKDFYEVDIYLNRAISNSKPYTKIQTTLSIPKSYNR